MPIRTRILAVLSFFGALYLAFYLRTRWGSPLPDVGYVHSPSSKPTWTATDRSMDVESTYTQSAPCDGDDYTCDGEDYSYGAVIGIELGNGYYGFFEGQGSKSARVALFEKGHFFLLVNDEGQRETPNYVTFTDQGPVTGLKAKEQADSDPENTIYDFRRFLGRKFSDPSLQEEIDLLPYKVIEKDGRPWIQVKVKGNEMLYNPEQVTAAILKRMKETAEEYTINKVTHAVISVPAYFTDDQRQATKEAGIIAGLDIMRIIDEPRAAAMAYRLDVGNQVTREARNKVLQSSGKPLAETTMNCPGTDDESCYLVFNLEERGCDVTIMNVDRGVFETLGKGTSDFGSRDFDHDLFIYLFNLAKDLVELELSEDFEGIARLNSVVKKAQETLSNFPYAQIDSLWSYRGQLSFPIVVTRKTVEILHSESSYDKVLALVEQVLTDANLDKSAIDGLIVTGEPSYTAKIRPILEAHFESAKLYSDIRSDEVVVSGVAKLAAILAGEDSSGYEVFPMLELAPLGLGIETAGGFYTKIIRRTEMLPTRNVKTLTTATDNQEKMVLKIYEGQRPMAKHNRYLGSLELEISKNKRGEVEVEVAFEMVDEFNLAVIVKERGGGKEARVVFDERTFPHGRSEEIDEVITVSREFYEADLQEEEQAISENRWKEDDGSGVVVVIYPGERYYPHDSDQIHWWKIWG